MYYKVMPRLVLFAFLVFGLCAALPAQNKDDNDRLVAIASRVDAIDIKLNGLSEGQDQHSLFTRIEQKLDSIETQLDALTTTDQRIINECRQTPGDRQQKPSQEEDKEQEVEEEQQEFPYYNSVNILSVTRRPSPGQNTFVLEFTKNVDNVHVRFQGDVGFNKPPDSVTEKGGVFSAVYTSQLTQRDVWVVFSDEVDDEEGGWSFMTSRHILHLRLNNSEGDAIVQQLDPFPELHLDPPRKAIYKAGQDFNLTGSFTFSGDQPEDFHMFETLQGINMANGKVYMDMDRNGILQKIYEEYNPNKTDETVTALTSATTVIGYFSFGLALPMQGPVVLRAQITRSVPFRPSNQTTLPSNYLGIMEVPYATISENGNERHKCRPSEECKLSCFGVGEYISDMQVVKLLPDGTKEHVLSATKPDIGNDQKHIEAIVWAFQGRNDTEDDSDGITTFECTAIDVTNNKQVSKVVEALVVLNSGIDESKTNVTVEENDMEPHTKILTFNCAVYGRPIPEVTFSSGTSYIFNMDSYQPDSVVSTGRNTAVATKTLSLDMDYLREYRYRIYENDIMPSCQFWSLSQHQSVEHTFQIPDLNLENKM